MSNEYIQLGLRDLQILLKNLLADLERAINPEVRDHLMTDIIAVEQTIEHKMSRLNSSFKIV